MMKGNWRRVVLGVSFSSMVMVLVAAAPAGPPPIPMDRFLEDLKSSDVRVRNDASGRIKKILAEAEASGDPARISEAMAALRGVADSRDEDPESRTAASALLASYLAGAPIWRLPDGFFSGNAGLPWAHISGKTVLVSSDPVSIGKVRKEDGTSHPAGALHRFTGFAMDDGRKVWSREDVFVPFTGIVAAAIEGDTIVAAGFFGMHGEAEPDIGSIVASPDLAARAGPDPKGPDPMDRPPRWIRNMPKGYTVISLSIARDRVAIATLAPFTFQELMTNNQVPSALHVWRSDTGEPVWKVDLPNVMLAGVEMLDGKVLAWGIETEKGWIGLFDAGNGKPLAHASIEGTTMICRAALRGDAYALVGRSQGESWTGTFTFDRAGQRGTLADRQTYCMPPLTPGLVPTLTPDGCVIADGVRRSVGLFRYRDADAEVSQ